MPSPLTPVSVFFLGWIGLVTTDEIAIACDKTNRWPFSESFAVVLGTVLVALGELRKPLRMMTLAGGKEGVFGAAVLKVRGYNMYDTALTGLERR